MREEPSRIVFLDDNEDLRQLMPMLLENALGVECMCFSSPVEFEQHPEEVLGARVAILDINLGPNSPDGLDAFHWLKDRGFHGKILFLTGHARANPDVARAVNKGVEIFEKPLHPEKLVSFIRCVLQEIT